MATLAGSQIVSNLVVRLVGDATGLQATLAQANGKVAAASRAMATTGMKMSKYVTLPVLAGGAAAGKMAYDFEKSMTDIKAMVGASEHDMKLYEKAIMSLAGETARAPKELADAMYFISSSGFEGAAATRVLESSAKAAEAGMGDTMTVADALTSAVNAYGEKALSASRATDIMVKAVKVGKMEPSELAANIGDVVTAAKVMGVEFDEVAGSLAAMSLTGISTPEAVTALNSFLSGLTKGTDAGAKALEGMGLSYESLRTMVKDKGVVAAMKTLYERVGGDMEKISDIVPNVRARKALFAMMEMEGGKLEQVFKEVTDSAGATATAYEKAKDSGHALRKAWAQLQVAGISIGNVLLPMAASVANGIGKLFGAFNKLPEPLKKFITYAGLAAAAVGPLLLVSAKLLTAWRTIASIGAASKIAAVGTAGSTAAGGLGAGSSAAGALAGSFTRAIAKAGLLAGAIAGTTYAIYKAIEAWADYDNAVQQARDAHTALQGNAASAEQYIIDKYGKDSPQYRKWMQGTASARKAAAGPGYQRPWWDVPGQVKDVFNAKPSGKPTGKGTGSGGLPSSKPVPKGTQNAVAPWLQAAGWQAAGGSYLVNKPTLFGAGEAGLERVDFTPVASAQGGGTGGRPQVHITIQGVPGRRQLEQLKRDLAAVDIGGY